MEWKENYLRRAPQTTCWKEAVVSVVRGSGSWDELGINFYSIYGIGTMVPSLAERILLLINSSGTWWVRTEPHQW